MASTQTMVAVDRFVDHGAPLSFRELWERVVPDQPDYLLLDLDKTTHLGRNLGELLEWELCAHEVYGDSYASRPIRRAFGGRMLLDGSQPLRLAQYLVSGAKRWTSAGVFYLVWAKLASRIPRLRRFAYRRFGEHPTMAVQRRPQTVALRHLATADESLLRKLGRRVWARQASDQVISREDLDWIRSRAPGIQIILSSASPKPILDVAVEELGADFACYSTPERINAGPAKIDMLRSVCPQLLDPNAKVIAITDTGYGEDHCWSEHFACVVDINSPTPFAPIVSHASPTREVHSALVLTAEEKRRRAAGEPSYVDPRRFDGVSRPYLDLDRSVLDAVLGDALNQINQIAASETVVAPDWEEAYRRMLVLEAARASVVDVSPRTNTSKR